MDYQDAAHRLSDGDTPDHIVLSEEMWNFLDETHKFEQLANDNLSGKGFVGMNVWKSDVLDKRDKDALLLSTEAFNQLSTNQ